MADVNKFYIDYSHVHNTSIKLANEISAGISFHSAILGRSSSVKLVAVARGGLLPGVIISHALNMSLLPIAYSSKTGKGDNKNHSNELPTIDEDIVVVIDDIADTSQTLIEITQHYQQQGKSVISAVLFWKNIPNKYMFRPTFYGKELGKNSPWIVFPFENTDPMSNKND
jgi:hypoxanthine phosphoribosyltransferase